MRQDKKIATRVHFDKKASGKPTSCKRKGEHKWNTKQIDDVDVISESKSKVSGR